MTFPPIGLIVWRRKGRIAIFLIIAAMTFPAIWWNATQLPRWRERARLRGEPVVEVKLAISPDNKSLAELLCPQGDGRILTLAVYDIGKCKVRFVKEMKSSQEGTTGAPLPVFSPDGRWIVVARDVVDEPDFELADVWDVETGRKPATLNDPDYRGIKRMGAYLRAAFSRDGRRLTLEYKTSFSQTRKATWDTTNWRPEFTNLEDCQHEIWVGALGPTNGLAIAADHGIFAYGTDDGAVKLCQLCSRHELASVKRQIPMKGQSLMQFTPGTQAVLLGDWFMKNRLEIWDTRTRATKLLPPELSLHSFDKQGHAMLLAGEGILQIREIPSGTLRAEIRDSTIHGILGFAPDGEHLLVQHVIDPGEWIDRLPAKLQSLINSTSLVPRSHEEVVSYGTSTGRPSARLDLKDNDVFWGVFSPDGKLLVTEDGKGLTLWEAPR